MIAGTIEKALAAAGVPIDGVSVERRDDKRTWRIDFKAEASAAQKAAAQAVLDAFDPANPPRPAAPTVEQALASIGLSLAALKTALGLDAK